MLENLFPIIVVGIFRHLCNNTILIIYVAALASVLIILIFTGCRVRCYLAQRLSVRGKVNFHFPGLGLT